MSKKKPRPGTVMPGVCHDIDCHGEPVEILPLADLHVGDPHSNADLIRELVDSVASRPNRYAVLVGDLMNTAIQGGKSDVYGEALTPQEQLQRCRELLQPIAGKILGIVPGNHEERIYRQSGIDTPAVLAQLLSLSSVYSPTSQLVFLRFGTGPHTGPLTYSLYLNHGHGGGGRRAGSKANSLQDFGSVIDADVVIVGHTHLPITFKQSHWRVVCPSGNKKPRAELHEQLFVNTASSLMYGGYGDRGGYQPPSNSYPVIILDNARHAARVTL